MTTTQSPSTEQPKTASDAGARPYATVNPYTGETEAEFPFLPTEEVDGVVETAHAAFLEWRRRTPEERAAVQLDAHVGGCWHHVAPIVKRHLGFWQ